MTARKTVVARPAQFLSEVIDAAPFRSRAAELVQSGLLDRACQIATLSHELADAVISEMDAQRAARRCRGALVICELLTIGMKRLYELLGSGELDSFRIGRARRIPTASIRSYIARQLANGD